jgi:hypothetical protein
MSEEVDLIQLGHMRIKELAQVPLLVQENGRLKKELAECKARAFNTPEYRDTMRRCCDACNELADLRKLVDELRLDNAGLRTQLALANKGGGFPPPDYEVPKPVYEE